MVLKLSTKMIILFVLVVIGSLAAAPFAHAALAARGPVNPDNGFPIWYQDANGLALSLCSDPADANCLADPVDPGNPISVAVGFGDEAFWWDTESLITLPAGTPVVGSGQALLVLAMEAAWLTGSPAAGQHQTFGRVRMRVDVGVAGTYTVTHPFGETVFNVPQSRIDATGGTRAIDDADVGPVGVPGTNGLTLVSTDVPLGDIGCVVAPCDFDLALASGVGPFLTAVSPAPPPGYLGTGLAGEHTITGGVNNEFTVTGPAGAFGVGVNSVTDTTFNVSGKTMNIVPAAGDTFWTWYDNASANFQNFVLMGKPATTAGAPFNFSVQVAGVPKSAPGATSVAAGTVAFATFPGTIGGPVKVTELSAGRAITSQRTLLGNSLDEVVGQEFERLSNRFVWTWYDNSSPGFANWVLISNPDPSDQIFYRLSVGGIPVAEASIPGGGTVTPRIPGLMGGPVEVQAWSDAVGGAVAADIMASQRVLSNNGQALNEEPGIPDGIVASEVSDNYNWTWYDMASPGAANWIMVANHEDVGNVFYDVIINGLTVVDNAGPVAPNDTDLQTFPGTIGGPVQVSCFSDAGGTVATDCVASQRVIWGPSFEETYGKDDSDLQPVYHWTWYDMLTGGAQNWVMVSNPPASAGGAGVAIDYQIVIGGVTVDNNTLGPIPINGEVLRLLPGTRNGPVEVRTFNTGTTTPANSVASQRVIWGGTHFNEVMGTSLLAPVP